MASERADATAWASSAGSLTVRIPCHHPRRQPLRGGIADFFSQPRERGVRQVLRNVLAPWDHRDTGTLRLTTRAAVLFPISAITSGSGPMNVSPASRTAAANASFSARNP